MIGLGETITVVVSGMVARVPHQGGATWSVLQYVLGLRELGHRAFLVEEIAADDLRPAGVPLAESENARYFRRVVASFGLTDASCLLVSGTRQTVGLTYDGLLAAARRADCLLNISGALKDEQVKGCIALCAYLDVDPAFTQFWELQGYELGLEGHSRFATAGLALGLPNCPVPTGGREWIPTLPPVVLSEWPVSEESSLPAFTTVANWRGYGGIDHDGVFYGQKAHSFRPLFDLPRHTGEEFVLAMAIDPEETQDVEALSTHGWRLVDPSDVASNPDRYRSFVAGSMAELGVAKSGYVRSRCGWFSDRSACYLASGKPVVAEDTGIQEILPTGEGLVTFSTPDEAAETVLEVKGGYRRHSEAARIWAEELLDARRVVSALLDRVGASS